MSDLLTHIRKLIEAKGPLTVASYMDLALQHPDDAHLQLWFGQACLQNGRQADGVAALKVAAANAMDPAVLASVAATLAGPGAEPEMAIAAARHAVTLVEQQTSELTLADLTTEQLKQMVVLAETWTQMSVTALKIGDLETAEHYARAAWNLSEEPSAGDQLGQVLERKGNLAEAFDAYDLAAARPYPRVAGLSDRLEALRNRMGPGKTPTHKETTVDRLQGLRTVKITPPKPFSASADFLVLFANGKVSDVKQLGGDARAMELVRQLKQAPFDVPFPDNGPEHIIRQGILSCSVYDTKCMFLMMLPGDATTNSRTQQTPLSAPVRIQLEPGGD